MLKFSQLLPPPALQQQHLEIAISSSSWTPSSSSSPSWETYENSSSTSFLSPLLHRSNFKVPQINERESYHEEISSLSTLFPPQLTKKKGEEEKAEKVHHLEIDPPPSPPPLSSSAAATSNYPWSFGARCCCCCCCRCSWRSNYPVWKLPKTVNFSTKVAKQQQQPTTTSLSFAVHWRPLWLLLLLLLLLLAIQVHLSEQLVFYFSLSSSHPLFLFQFRSKK